MKKASESKGAILVGLCGSLRTGSTNHTLLVAASRLAPNGSQVCLYEGVGRLPHYSPDADVEPLPEEVVQLRARVRAADCLIVSCPEYAGGIPGSFKNGLDWLVGGDEMYGKCVAIWRVSSRGEWLTTSLRRVLSTLASKIVDEHVFAPWPGGRGATAVELVRAEDTAGEIRTALGKCLVAAEKERAVERRAQ